LSFHFDGTKTWLPHAILVSDWPIKNPLPSETMLCQLKPKCAGMTFERFFTKIPNFILIGQKIFGHHRQFFFLIEALNIFYTETASQIKVDVCWIFKKKKKMEYTTCDLALNNNHTLFSKS
jgi:hypothetical protein